MNLEDIIRLDLANKTPAELLEYFPYNAPIEEQVYETMMGHLIPECRLNWVETIFVPGSDCYEAYDDMCDAYEQLRERIGAIDEDPDVETIINSLLLYGRISAMKMFEYGRKYERMQNSK